MPMCQKCGNQVKCTVLVNAPDNQGQTRKLEYCKPCLAKA